MAPKRSRHNPMSPRILSLMACFGIPAFVTATWSQGLGLMPLPVWLISVNLMLLAVLGKDKFAATKNSPYATRTPEFTLLALTFAGGTPALFVGRWLFSHKTSKRSFIAAMWGTIAVQVVCIWYFRVFLATHMPLSFPYNLLAHWL
ncbi:MAG: DUF1294 domain-containing protein [Proteobacteria bacterium]|nr:DUF1294 domain-containing protein [Pseudomonadota bacterium]